MDAVERHWGHLKIASLATSTDCRGMFNSCICNVVDCEGEGTSGSGYRKVFYTSRRSQAQSWVIMKVWVLRASQECYRTASLGGCQCYSKMDAQLAFEVANKTRKVVIHRSYRMSCFRRCSCYIRAQGTVFQDVAVELNTSKYISLVSRPPNGVLK